MHESHTETTHVSTRRRIPNPYSEEGISIRRALTPPRPAPQPATPESRPGDEDEPPDAGSYASGRSTR